MYFSPLNLIPIALRCVVAEVGAAVELSTLARLTRRSEQPRQTATAVTETPITAHTEQTAVAAAAPQSTVGVGGNAASLDTAMLPAVAAAKQQVAAAVRTAAPAELSPELVAEIDSATGAVLFTAAEVEEAIAAAHAPTRTVQIPAEVLPEMCCTMTLAKLTLLHPTKKAQLVGTFVSAFLYEGGCDDEECRACPPDHDESESAVVVQYVPETGDRSIRTIELDPESSVQLAL